MSEKELEALQASWNARYHAAGDDADFQRLLADDQRVRRVEYHFITRCGYAEGLLAMIEMVLTDTPDAERKLKRIDVLIGEWASKIDQVTPWMHVGDWTDDERDMAGEKTEGDDAPG